MSDIQVIGQLTELQRQVNNIYIPERSQDIVSTFLDLPGLVGLWYGGNYRRGLGDLLSIATWSGADLTLNGTKTNTFDFLDNGTAYINFTGVNYFTAADSLVLRIQGNEGYVVNSGLTAYSWLKPGTTGTYQQVWGKANDSNGPYRFSQTAGNGSQFAVRNSTDTTTTTIGITNGLLTSEWAFHACRWIPSTELKIWRNTETNANTTSIPATLLNDVDSFGFGSEGDGGSIWTGYSSILALFVGAHNNAMVSGVFKKTRDLFGV